MTVATIDQPIQLDETTLPRWVDLLVPATKLADVLAQTDFVPRGLRGRPEAVAAAILLGDEIGIGPMFALSHISVVEGKPTPSAELMRALVLRAGHELWTETADERRAVVQGRRRDSERIEQVAWSIDDARRAGLLRRGSGWEKYPRAMLVARATAELCRRVFPDAIGGLSYLAEELQDTTDTPAASERAPGGRRVSRRAQITDTHVAVSSGDPASTERDPAAAQTIRVPGSSEPDRLSTATEAGQSPDSTDLSAPVESGPPAPSRAQMTKLQAMLNAAGVKERQRRLNLATLVAGRPISSSTELRAHEVSDLIDLLDHVAQNILRIEWTGDDGDQPFPVVVDDAPPTGDVEPDGDPDNAQLFESQEPT